MCNKNKILILPSWYATPEAPTSGSFFREQAELMLPEYDVRVLVASKRWISPRRYFYEKHFKPYKRVVSEYFVKTPPTYHFEYDFIKAFSDERNLEIELNDYADVLLGYFKNELNWGPDLIHAHSTLQGGIIAQYLSEKLQIPYCITEHMNPFVLHKYSDFWKTRIVEALEKANVVLAVSNHQEQHILMNEIDCRPIAVGNLVNENIFKIERNQPQQFTVVFVNYYPNFIKDVHTFFEALAMLKGEIHSIIVGGGELNGEYQSNIFEHLADRYGVKDYVEIIPKASRTEMNEIYNRSHALVSTSIAESFGVAICEAMLCGNPVVVTANGGCSEYMIEGKNGYVVPLKNTQALAEKIMLLKKNYSNFDSQYIRNHIVEYYGRLAFKNRISNIYNGLISG